MTEIPSPWLEREYNLEGLADFFNEYEIPFFGFGSSEKNKQLYAKQMAEIHEYVKPCLQVLMDEKHKKKYKAKKHSESLLRKIFRDVINDLIKKDLVAEKKIQKVKDNLLAIYKDPAFADFERVELSTYYERKVGDAIMLLNNEKFDLNSGELKEN